VAERIIVLSGRIASGKSTLARGLQERASARVFRTQDLLRSRLGPNAARDEMQREGARLDTDTSGAWVAEALAKELAAEDAPCIVVDSARQENQIEGIRRAFGAGVTHVHLEAPREALELRFAERRDRPGEAGTYEAAAADPVENAVDALSAVADVVVDTGRSNEVDVLVRTLGRLGLHAGVRRLVDVLVGGELGSEGKGHIAAHLAREYGLLVRVGGPNAGHTVMSGGTKHIYHHLPSGTLANEGAKLLLAPGAVVRIPKLLDEIAEFGVDWDRLTIDPQVMTISAADIRGEERGLRDRIGSTAQGVGYATARRVRRDPSVRLARDIRELRPYIRPAAEVLRAAYDAGTPIMVEGTQGTGLSLYHGPYPSVTSRDTTAAGCLAEAGISPSRVRRIVMVCRTYPIRVAGNSGPMAREITWQVVADRAGIPVEELAAAEKTSTTRRDRRVGEFDWVLFRQAVELNGPTDIALTFTDYISTGNRDARRFEQLTEETVRFIEEVEMVARAPVSLISTRFEEFRSIIDRRRW
jgi:adenylosuccinate synthase